ncbi:hypothetical protein PPYR_02957 [Photinus pyralis]|uniref:PID domain-containing protein n=2 Tax=Photinus pyralis TaxID=7054 RepID=A0A5N4A1F6_PHOPY|nr:uncharacterized protein LOC116160863 [Photinus pyralis]KAB0791157.1 hypothetical protein PPYR_02957 [Photinus pyralis]
MVVCNMEIPRPPPPPPPPFGFQPKSEDGGPSSFRLLDSQDETGSIYSVYKQKIDSMFESDSSSNTKNSVQAKIEKMFSDIASDGGISNKEIGCHVFSVDYVGSVALQQKVASLSGLQDPLKDLYFTYKSSTKVKKPLTSRLEISTEGLRIQYEGEKGDLERLNPFSTIAVWSAVKFVLQDQHGERASYAFLPLITDPDNMDKQMLFRKLNGDERRCVKTETHQPLVAIVMKNLSVERQLECHAFICQTSEDAIVIAATLYKSLMTHMKYKDRKPKNKNGITCMSVTSSVFNDSSTNYAPIRPPRKKRSTSSSAGSEKEGIDASDTQLLLSRSKPTPKKSVKTRRAPKAPDPPRQDLDAIATYEEAKDINPAILTEKWNTLMSAHQKQITAEIKQVISEGNHRGFQKIQSQTKDASKDAAGDILTKVTIPRSGSFLNAGGLTRYKSKISRINGQAAGGSPLGFNELFNEFRIQEGLHSVDDILGVIIDPEGMSFNDLKPIYKEFLLKLSLTLTKDELYQRSKAIMRKQKKRILRGVGVQARRKSRVGTRKFKTLKRIFRLRSKVGSRKMKHKTKVPEPPHSKKLLESSISTSSYDTKHFRPKASNGRKQGRKRSDKKQKDRVSTSEESDFFSLQRANSKGQFQNRNSSSGYVSCSECSYDSDTCTCVSADKCYCSLGHKNVSKKQRKCKLKSPEKCYCSADAMSACECDTDSCTDSNKCYCQKGQGFAIVKHLKVSGVMAERRTRRKLCKNNSNTKSTRSVEYMHNPTEKYYETLRSKEFQALAKRMAHSVRSFDNLAVGYESCTISNRNITNMEHGKSVSESGRPRVYNHASIRSVNSSCRFTERRSDGKSFASMSAGAYTEALAVKKAAEIAALFADIKLSQTTDIGHLVPPPYENDVEKIKLKSFIHGKRLDQGRMSKNNSLYSSSKMYSARNGLYTIQSQSDESRRSSVGEIGKMEFRRKIDGELNPVSSNIENSLGYLP